MATADPVAPAATPNNGNTGNDYDYDYDSDRESGPEAAAYPNLERFSNFTVDCFPFWIIKMGLVLAEPFIVSMPYSLASKRAQIAILVICTFQFVVQLIGDSFAKLKRINKHCDGEIIDFMGLPISKWFLPFRALKYYLTRAEYLLEASCLFCGWVFLFFRPGIAALRLFRVFVLLWYCERSVVRNGSIRWTYYLFGSWGIGVLRRIFDVMEFATLSLMSLGSEMFFVSDKTRGGFMLMCMLFYTAFVVGQAVFLDGNGFDLLYDLSKREKFLFFIVMIYLCMTTFGIVNGLLIVFSNSFQGAGEDAFNLDARKTSIDRMEQYAKTMKRRKCHDLFCLFFQRASMAQNGITDVKQTAAHANYASVKANDPTVTSMNATTESSAIVTSTAVAPPKPPKLHSSTSASQATTIDDAVEMVSAQSSAAAVVDKADNNSPASTLRWTNGLTTHPGPGPAVVGLPSSSRPKFLGKRPLTKEFEGFYQLVQHQTNLIVNLSQEISTLRSEVASLRSHMGLGEQTTSSPHDGSQP